MRPYIGVIHWLDAMGNRDDEMNEVPGEKLRGLHCLSLGVVIERTRGKRGHTKVAGELIEGGEYQEVQVIPNGMILTLRRLEIPLPKEFVGWTVKKDAEAKA